VKKEEMTERRKAGRATKTKPPPTPTPLAQNLDPPLSSVPRREFSFQDKE